MVQVFVRTPIWPFLLDCLHILRGGILQVHVIDPGAPLHIVGHPGRGHDVIHRQAGVGLQSGIIRGGAGEAPSGRGAQALGVHLFDPLHHLEQPRPAGDAIGFQRGRDRQTDGLLRAAQVCHHKVGGQGIEATLKAFDGCVEALKIKPISALLE